jgi:hypothetical protein
MTALVVAVIGTGVWAAAGGQWLIVAAAVAAGLALATAAPTLRSFTAQRELGPLCDELREIARSVPTGTVRLFEHDASGLAVQCVPAGRGRADCFSRYALRDIEPIEDAAPGEVVRFPLTTVRVHRVLPMAARRVWVDQLVKDAETGPVRAVETASAPPQTAASADRADSRTRAASRTGLLLADRDDLEQILRLLWASDRITDIPVGTP